MFIAWMNQQMIMRITMSVVVDFHAIALIVELQTFEINLRN